ncbi:MAG TPA: hypothetical protein PLV78_00475 [Deltaproteobacteria bacterium]|nr:hypothetical protein [Deltaproteobacteria bacterium]
MISQTIRVFPLSKTKEREMFGTIEKVSYYFSNVLPARNPPGSFYIPNDRSNFEKESLILFQYAERKNDEKIIGHAVLLSDGCIHDSSRAGYIGYYLLDLSTIVIYDNPVTKEEVFKIWKKLLFQSKLNLDVSKYGEYMTLLKDKGNLRD